MDANTIFQTLLVHSYVFIFLLMIIEGPIVTAIAAFAASTGLFNIWIIFLLSIFGNLIPDTIFYFIGRFGRHKKTEKWVYNLGLTKQKIKKLEKGFENHAGKTLVFAKLTPPFPVPGLILSGFAKVPMKKFFFIDIIFNVISAIIATSLGFYLGMASTSVFKYLKIGQYAILAIIPIGFLIYIIYRKVFTKK